jgi:ribosomal protein S18 acetylase RimI-like enzyme
MRISLRPASPEDFTFCANLYFAGRNSPNEEMEADLRRRWHVSEVRIITLEDADVGWLQTRSDGDALFIVQLFIDAPYQRHGHGTHVMHKIIKEANAKAVTLGVVKTNPALSLYKRLGFSITHEDERKSYMRRDPNPLPPG